MCSTPRITFAGGKSPWSAITRLAMFLARSPIRSRSLDTRIAATISRRSTAIGWRRAMVRIAFSSISRCRLSMARSERDHALRQRGVALGERVDRVGDLLLGEAAHLGDHAGELLQIGVESLGGVVGHCLKPSGRVPVLRQPKRPVM